MEAVNVLEDAIATIKKNAELKVGREVERANAIHKAYYALKNEGVNNLPDEIEPVMLQYGFTVSVEKPGEWGKIHKAVGKLKCYSKDVIGNRTDAIKLVMAPGDYEHPLFYYLHFTTVKKLNDKDRCKVQKVVKETAEVVCGI